MSQKQHKPSWKVNKKSNMRVFSVSGVLDVASVVFKMKHHARSNNQLWCRCSPYIFRLRVGRIPGWCCVVWPRHNDHKGVTGILQSSTNLLVEVFPEVLGHESEQGEERPTEGVEASVAVVWITTSFDTWEALWTEPVRTHRYYEQQLPGAVFVYSHMKLFSSQLVAPTNQCVEFYSSCNQIWELILDKTGQQQCRNLLVKDDLDIWPQHVHWCWVSTDICCCCSIQAVWVCDSLMIYLNFNLNR